MKVYILEIGAGDDGDETRVEGVYATREIAQHHVEAYHPTSFDRDHRFHIAEYEVEDKPPSVNKSQLDNLI